MVGFNQVRAFIREEDGVASVDWIVLSAACVALGFGVTNVVATEMSNLTQEIHQQLEIDSGRNPFDIPAGADCAPTYIDPASDPGSFEGDGNVYTGTGVACGHDQGTGIGNDARHADMTNG